MNGFPALVASIQELRDIADAKRRAFVRARLLQVVRRELACLLALQHLLVEEQTKEDAS